MRWVWRQTFTNAWTENPFFLGLEIIQISVQRKAWPIP